MEEKKDIKKLRGIQMSSKRDMEDSRKDIIVEIYANEILVLNIHA